jgi:hypothetical protein
LCVVAFINPQDSAESNVRDPGSRIPYTLTPMEEVLKKNTKLYQHTGKTGIAGSRFPVSEVLSHSSHEAVIHEYELEIQDGSNGVHVL